MIFKEMCFGQDRVWGDRGYPRGERPRPVQAAVAGGDMTLIAEWVGGAVDRCSSSDLAQARSWDQAYEPRVVLGARRYEYSLIVHRLRHRRAVGARVRPISHCNAPTASRASGNAETMYPPVLAARSDGKFRDRSLIGSIAEMFLGIMAISSLGLPAHDGEGAALGIGALLAVGVPVRSTLKGLTRG